MAPRDPTIFRWTEGKGFSSMGLPEGPNRNPDYRHAITLSFGNDDAVSPLNVQLLFQNNLPYLLESPLIAQPDRAPVGVSLVDDRHKFISALRDALIKVETMTLNPRGLIDRFKAHVLFPANELPNGYYAGRIDLDFETSSSCNHMFGALKFK